MVWPYPATNRDKAVAFLAALVVQLFIFRLFTESQHHLVAVGTTINLGRVSVGQSMEKQFSIPNPTSQPIEILQWTPTCRCMQARFEQTVIPPHSEIAAFVHTTAARPLGARAANIAIRWRYMGEQAVRTDNLLVKARYISDFALSEERLNFGNVSSNDSPVHVLDLRSENTGSKWDDLEISCDSGSLSVQVLKKVDKYQLQAILRPQTLPSGVWKDTIRIFTLLNSKRTGDEIDIPVVAKIEGSIRANPSVIQLSSRSPQPQFFSIKLHSSALPISGLKFVGDLVQNPEITIREGGKEAVMTGFLATPVTKGAYAGKIPIEINNAPDQIIQVSFFGYAS